MRGTPVAFALSQGTVNCGTPLAAARSTAWRAKPSRSSEEMSSSVRPAGVIHVPSSYSRTFPDAMAPER